MADLIFALNAVMPIVLLVAIGYLLKRLGIFAAELARPVNKIVFRVLLPAMLFNNVYKIGDIGSVDPTYLIFVAVSVVVLFGIAVPLSALMTKERSRRAVLIQAVFRSNYALIGIPLAVSIGGESGSAAATLLSAVSIPVFNVCAVTALSLFDPSGKRPSVLKVLRGIVTNPLVLGIAAGLAALGIRAALGAWEIDFSLYRDVEPVGKVIGYLSSAATPIALLSLGAQFEFSAIASAKREIIWGTLLRTLIVPAACLGVALCIPTLNAGHYAAFIGLYATPLAVSTVPMTQEMGSDSDLAGQLVIFTTLASGFGIFMFTYLLKLIGVF